METTLGFSRAQQTSTTETAGRRKGTLGVSAATAKKLFEIGKPGGPYECFNYRRFADSGNARQAQPKVVFEPGQLVLDFREQLITGFHFALCGHAA